jgi:hypothetical protein
MKELTTPSAAMEDRMAARFFGRICVSIGGTLGLLHGVNAAMLGMRAIIDSVDRAALGSTPKNAYRV